LFPKQFVISLAPQNKKKRNKRHEIKKNGNKQREKNLLKIYKFFLFLILDHSQFFQEGIKG
jgi:hypothetical protein